MIHTYLSILLLPRSMLTIFRHKLIINGLPNPFAERAASLIRIFDIWYYRLVWTPFSFVFIDLLPLTNVWTPISTIARVCCIYAIFACGTLGCFNFEVCFEAFTVNLCFGLVEYLFLSEFSSVFALCVWELLLCIIIFGRFFDMLAYNPHAKEGDVYAIVPKRQPTREDSRTRHEVFWK